jgi:hypothetical protein
MDSSDRFIRANGTGSSTAISLLHSSRHLMWMDCTTAGQTVLYHALFICLVHLRLDSSDRLVRINSPLLGLRYLLTSLQPTSNVDGLYYRRTDCTVSCSICLVHLRMDSSDRLIRTNGTVLASAISLPHSSRHLMWMDCTTAGQIVRYHYLVICLVHLRLDSSDRLIRINLPHSGLRNLLTSLQLTSNSET